MTQSRMTHQQVVNNESMCYWSGLMDCVKLAEILAVLARIESPSAMNRAVLLTSRAQR
jgi:hypothetical protein